MDLKDFLKESLIQIITGVNDAKNMIPKENGEVTPDLRFSHQKADIVSQDGSLIHNVHFDIAVSVTEVKGKEGSAGISVLGMNVGGKGESSVSNGTVSRIQFHVPISFTGSKG